MKRICIIPGDGIGREVMMGWEREGRRLAYRSSPWRNETIGLR